MFATGLPDVALAFFASSTTLIAIPTAVKVFNWTATLWGGSIITKTPLLFAVAFLTMFPIGGLSGVSLAVVPFDWQITDTYVVAHIHYVFFGGTALGILAAMYYWFPKVTGRMLSEKIGLWNFWFVFIGLNLTFFPMHMLGLLGMPRRQWTVPSGARLESLQSRRLDRRVPDRHRHPLLHHQSRRLFPERRARGRGPVGCLDARMGDRLAAAGLQLHQDAGGALAPPLWDQKHPDDQDWMRGEH